MDDETVAINFRIPAAVHKEAVKRAKDDHRSLNAYMVVAVEERNARLAGKKK